MSGKPAESNRDPDDISRAPDPRDELDPPQWRQDFPIDGSKDEFVARRDFAKFMVLTSGAFAAGQGWIAAQDLVRKHRAVPARVKIAARSSIPVGGVATFAFPNPHDQCLLVRLDAHEFVAYSQACTHLSCPVVPNVAESLLVCPCHEGSFDLRTGRNLSGPPTRPLPRITLALEGDDVYATALDDRTLT
ncbi:MAG: ubiquinol-cytochrome c reductase iron-sulfur subunit [Polyangiales bacterium]